MKRIFVLLLTVALALTVTATALADGSRYYPVEVREYTEGDSPHIEKVYHLSLTDDPSLIPVGNFDRNGYLFRLLDVTKSYETGIDGYFHTETVTIESDTNKLEKILPALEAQLEVVTDDGYAGILLLDTASVKVEAKGYKTSSKTLTATRIYPNLSDADLSLLPKTIQDGGNTLELADVQWSSDYQADGTEHFTATVTYTATKSSTYATGYIVTANYSGDVTKVNCEMAVYTAIFVGEKTTVPIEQERSPEPMVDDLTPEPETPAINWLPVAGIALGGLALVGGGAFGVAKLMEKRKYRV